MNFHIFFKAVDNMVKEWQPDDAQAGATPRNALRVLYDEIREQAVYEVAEAIRKREEKLAIKLHKHYLTGKDR
jgi:hypothetical protein